MAAGVKMVQCHAKTVVLMGMLKSSLNVWIGHQLPSGQAAIVGAGARCGACRACCRSCCRLWRLVGAKAIQKSRSLGKILQLHVRTF